jgi:hypothetical protein
VHHRASPAPPFARDDETADEPVEPGDPMSEALLAPAGCRAGIWGAIRKHFKL